jgi:hypothetical protein
MNVKKALGPKPTAMDRTSVRAIRQSNKGVMQVKSTGPRSPAHRSGNMVAWSANTDLGQYQKDRNQAARSIKAGRAYAAGKATSHGSSPSFNKGYRSGVRNAQRRDARGRFA